MRVMDSFCVERSIEDWITVIILKNNETETINNKFQLENPVLYKVLNFLICIVQKRSI